jgi:hypothetical protein
MPVNYALGKVYKIIDNTNDQCYVGSTCEPILARRLAGHVRDYKCYLNGKRNYVSSFEILKNGNYDIILVENFPCGNKDELHARERHWTNEIPCINKIKCQGIIAEIGQVEYHKQFFKQYYDANKEKIKAYSEDNKEKLRKKFQCLCGGKYTFENISIHNKTKKHLKYIEEQQADEEAVIEV